MKLQLIGARLIILCGLLFPALVLAQNLASLNTSDLPFGSSIKGLYHFQHFQEDITNGGFVYENGSTLALTTDDTGIDYSSSSFYFWIVENLEEEYFQIYSATQTGKVLSVGQNGSIAWTSYSAGTEPSTKTKLHFRMLTTGPMRTNNSASEVAIGYMTTIYDATAVDVENTDCKCNFLKVGGATKFITTPSGREFLDYRAVVFENSSTSNTEGTISQEISTDGSSLTRIVQTNTSSGTDAHTFVSSKFQASGFGSQDFKISIASGTEGYIGFSDYLHHDLKAEVFKNARPKLGLKVANDAISLIYLNGNQQLPFNKQITAETATNITMGSPFTFGFKNQNTLVAKQNGVAYELKTEAPAEFFINQSITKSTRLLVRLLNGEVTMAYTLKDGLIALNNALGTETNYISTDPYMPHNKPNALINTFDWRETKWDIRYKGLNNTVVSTTEFSPFNVSHLTEFKYINNKYDLQGNYKGGADYEYVEGWELVKANLGYTAAGQALNPAPNYPYAIMYNKMSGKLRVFVYASNLGEANQLVVELKAAGGNPDAKTIYTPKLWGSLQQFKSYDAVKSSNYRQVTPYNSTEARSWYFTDFTMEYDPCLAFFEAYVQISILKSSVGELTLVGRSLGGAVASGTPEYNEWQNKRENFLIGVMDASSGTLANSVGDITFSQYDQYDVKDFAQSMNAVLVGKEVADWEKERARLDWEGTRLESQATIAEGTLLIAEGVAKIGEGASKMAPGLGGFSEGGFKAAQGVAAMGRGASKIVAGAGKGKIARSKKLVYDNIKDKVKHSDQNIVIPIPEPRPQMVFGELALKGELNITVNLSTENYLAVPGALNSELAPEWRLPSSRASQPLYNIPMGQFTMLEKPQFAVGVSQGKHDRFQAWLKIKEKPYFAHNNAVYGKIGDIIALSISVETLNDKGYSAYTASGPAYTTRFGKGLDNELSGEHNITNLVKWSQIKANIQKLSDKSDANIEANLRKWIKISYEAWSITASNLKSRNLKRILGNSDRYYEGNTAFKYLGSSKAYYNEILGDAMTKANEAGTYNFVDNPTWSKYHVYHTDYQDSKGSFYQTMNTYCSLLNPNAKANAMEEDPKLQADTDGLIADIDKAKELKVHPNPAQDTVNFLIKSPIPGEVVISLYDMTGNLLIQTSATMDGTENLKGKLGISPLNPGVYILRAELPNKDVLIQKVIKR